MTQKQIIRMASDFEIQWRLREIDGINSNMCHKTVFEQATAKRKMKQYAREIQEILNSEEETEEAQCQF